MFELIGLDSVWSLENTFLIKMNIF